MSYSSKCRLYSWSLQFFFSSLWPNTPSYYIVTNHCILVFHSIMNMTCISCSRPMSEVQHWKGKMNLFWWSSVFGHFRKLLLNVWSKAAFCSMFCICIHSHTWSYLKPHVLLFTQLYDKQLNLGLALMVYCTAHTHACTYTHTWAAFMIPQWAFGAFVYPFLTPPVFPVVICGPLKWDCLW